MTINNLVILLDALNKVGNLTGVKFSYFAARNKNILKPIMATFEENRKALIESHGKKEDGKLVVEDNQYVFEDKESFDKAFQDLMKEEVETPKFFKIDLTEIPKEITSEQMSGIFELINEVPE